MILIERSLEAAVGGTQAEKKFLNNVAFREGDLCAQGGEICPNFPEFLLVLIDVFIVCKLEIFEAGTELLENAHTFRPEVLSEFLHERVGNFFILELMSSIKA